MKKDVYELTIPQTNILQLEQINSSDNCINNIFGTMKFNGHLNSEILGKTFNKIIELNDSFRIKILKEEDGYFQTITDYTYESIDVITIQTDDISDFIESYKNKHIDLKNKLFKFSILYTLSYTFVIYESHHIISDAWSMTQVAEQIKEIYTKIMNQEDLTTYTKPSYLMLLNREENYLNSTRYQKDKEFWSAYVKKMDNLKLFHATNLLDKKSIRYEKTIDENLFKYISKFCTKYNISEYSFFLGIIFLYFYKLHNAKNITFGTPFLNRIKRNGEFDCTGIFISTLPINIDIQDITSFVELCQHINSENLKLFRHSNFPYPEMESLYRKENHLNSNLYDIGFSYQVNKLDKKLDNEDTGNCKWHFSGSQNNPITFHISSINGEPIMYYDYMTTCFTQKDIIQMDTIIFTMMEDIIYHSHIDISSLCILPKVEQEKLSVFNDRGEFLKNELTIIEMFEKSCKQYPKNIALRYEEQSIFYEELKQRIDVLASYLTQYGIKKNTPVALMFDKSIEMIVAMFSVLKAGGCYVPILPEENLERIQFILEDCTPACILSHHRYTDQLHDNTIPCIDITKLEVAENTHFKTATLSPEDTAYIIYTSGSTGKPKGVQVMHKNVTGLMYSMMQDSILAPTYKDISMSLLKYSFDASGIDIYSALLFGGTLVLISKAIELNPQLVLDKMEHEKITRSFLIPKWIEHIALEVKTHSYHLSNLRLLGSGGETLKPNLLANLYKKYPNLSVLNLYGPTETTMFSTYKIVKMDEIKRNYSSIGKPIPCSRAFVVNEQNSVLPTNYKGELILFEDKNSIKNISKGYLNLSEQNQNKFITIKNPITNEMVHAYKTGDIVKINEHLELEFIERNDDVVKVNGGYLVALNEVEKRISDILGIGYHVLPVAIPFKNSKTIILFLCRTNKNLSIEKVKSYINNHISFYMKPRVILELDAFPRNNSGKIDKAKLKQMSIDYIKNRNSELIPPQTKTEKYLAQVIKNILDIEDISVTDDFIEDLGIDSLSLTKLFAEIESENLRIQDLYNHSNIKDLSYFIDSQKNYKIVPNLSDISDYKILNNAKKFNLTKVLLTGVTGFLGVHLLHDLLFKNEVKEVYCIIRQKINKSCYKRLLEIVDYYFDYNPKLHRLIEEKVIVLNGDYTKDFFGLDPIVYENLQKQITTVLNSAADVRHFAKYSDLYKDNVISVDSIITFCRNKISLAHISTLSICGFKGEHTQNITFDENCLYIKQEFNNNPYLVSKFEAEKHILKATKKNGLNAKIFRLGNIMPRLSDGKFQRNYTQNVFMLALKMLLNMKVAPDSLNGLEIEFSPVDQCAKSIIYLLTVPNHNSVYHILNNHNIPITQFIEYLNELDYDIKIIQLEKFIQKMSAAADLYTKEYILNSNLNHYSLDKTLSILEKKESQWHKTDFNYIKKVLNIIKYNRW